MPDTQAYPPSPDEESIGERDRRLLLAWQRGERSEGFELLQHYLPLFYQLCARRGITREDDFLDIQGELALELLKNLDRYWIGSSFASCIHVAFKSAFKRFVRSRIREVTVERIDEGSRVGGPDAERLADEEESESLLADVLGCTHRLTKGEYAVFSGRILEKRAYEEIARRTSATVGGLRVQYHRALAKIRDCLRAKGRKWAHA